MTISSIDMPTTEVNRKSIYSKWKKWRNRIRLEIVNLLVQQKYFHELQAVIKFHEKSDDADDAWEAVRWMAQGYATFAATAIRRLSERPNPPPKKRTTGKDPREIISIVALLSDIECNATLVTRNNSRRRYKLKMKHLPQHVYIDAADRVHDAVCLGNDVLKPETVAKDIKRIEDIVRRIKKRTEKSHAHIERDRRRIPWRISFIEFDAAIKLLAETFDRYSLCLFGETGQTYPLEEQSIKEALERLWGNDR